MLNTTFFLADSGCPINVNCAISQQYFHLQVTKNLTNYLNHRTFCLLIKNFGGCGSMVHSMAQLCHEGLQLFLSCCSITFSIWLFCLHSYFLMVARQLLQLKERHPHIYMEKGERCKVLFSLVWRKPSKIFHRDFQKTSLYILHRTSSYDHF